MSRLPGARNETPTPALTASPIAAMIVITPACGRRNQRQRERDGVHADVYRIAGQRQAPRDGAAPKLEQRDERRRQECKTQTARNVRRAHYGVLRTFKHKANSIAPNVTNVLLSAVRTTSALHCPCTSSIGVDRGMKGGTRSQ